MRFSKIRMEKSTGIYHCISLFHAKVEQTFTDGFSFIMKIEQIPGPLVVDPDDWPKCFDLAFSLMRLEFCLSHFHFELFHHFFNFVPSVRRRLLASAYFRHGSSLKVVNLDDVNCEFKGPIMSLIIFIVLI